GIWRRPRGSRRRAGSGPRPRPDKRCGSGGTWVTPLGEGNGKEHRQTSIGAGAAKSKTGLLTWPGSRSGGLAAAEVVGGQAEGNDVLAAARPAGAEGGVLAVAGVGRGGQVHVDPLDAAVGQAAGQADADGLAGVAEGADGVGGPVDQQ